MYYTNRSIVLRGCAFAACLHILILTITSYNSHQEIENGNFNIKLIRERKGEGSSKYSARWKTPMMNTFFEPVPGGCCGASEEGHRKLMSAWEESWRKKGWATRVLTLDDAKKHPDYEKMNESLARLDVSEYNRRCFFRWLAMAANGGGWMSDYDTFPLNFDAEVGARLGQYGIFTSFEKHVPSLISANKDEWERMVQTMITRLGKRNLKDGFISDMMMLKNIKDSMGKKAGRFGKTLVLGDSFKVAYELVEESKREVNCNRLRNMLAIHLSHASIDDSLQSGKFPIVGLKTVREAMELRADAALIFLSDYEKQCGDKNISF